MPSSPGTADRRRLDAPSGEADLVYRTIFGVVLDESAAATLLHETLVEALAEQGTSSVGGSENRIRLTGIAVDLALRHEGAGARNPGLGRRRAVSRHVDRNDPVRALLGPLTPGMRAMVVLHHYHRLGAGDIATVLDVAHETVRVQLSMAIELMRDHLPPSSARIAAVELDREIAEALCDGLDGTPTRPASGPQGRTGRVGLMAGGARRRLLVLALAATITSIAMPVAANSLLPASSPTSRVPLPTARASARPRPATTSSPAPTETPHPMPSLDPDRRAAPQPTSSAPPEATPACRSHDPHRCH